MGKKESYAAVPVYLQKIIKKIDDAIEAARKNGSCNITGLILARQIICQETRL